MIKKINRKIIIALILVIIPTVFALNIKEENIVKDNSITFTEVDDNLIAVMVEQTENTGDYASSSAVPTSGYLFNATNSYCKVNNVVDNNINIGYENGVLSFTNLKENTKCFLYFDKTLQAVMAAGSLGERITYGAANDTGIYQTDDTIDGSVVYYYTGNVQNNWVRFGSKNGTCYYWRIIRTNTETEGGGLRLLYAGSSTTCSGSVPVMTNAYINNTTYYYATSSGDQSNASYAGYMFDIGSQFGHGTSSYAKQQVDSWYTSSGLSNFASKINENAIYCSDRSVSKGTWTDTGDSFSYDGLIRTAGMYWGGSSWVNVALNPSLNCTKDEDKFSKGTSGGGNGYLTYPIALISSDELVFAGAERGTRSKAYYYYASDSSSSSTGSIWWWTMTPARYFNGYVGRFYVRGLSTGYQGSLEIFTGSEVDSTHGIRPVISLKSDVTITGSGTVSDPYEVEGTMPNPNGCTITQTGGDGFSADYWCENGTGTIAACRYNGTYGSATCNGGNLGSVFSYICISSNYNNLYGRCNTSLPSYNVAGGGLASSISCSC